MAVITVQLGNYANHIGAHFWNMQEAGFVYEPKKSSGIVNDLDHDVLHREGTTLDGRQVTYTPRLVSVDLKGALGRLPEFGDLYKEDPNKVSADPFWPGGVSVQKEETKDQDKEEEGGKVAYWSDYLRARYHPKTNVVVNEYQLGNVASPFDIHGLGLESWAGQGGQLGDEVEDRLRYFAEECDGLKGFNVYVDSTSAFGGLGVALSDLLKDEYHGQSNLTFPVMPASHVGLNATDSTCVMLNTALTLRGLAETCSLVTPLSLAKDTFPLGGHSAGHRLVSGLNYNHCMDYQSSAVLALAADTMSLPWRLKRASSGASPGQVAAGLATHGRSVAAMSACLPVRFDNKTPNLTNLVELTPNYDVLKSNDVWTQSVSARGLPGNENHLNLLGYYDDNMSMTKTAVTCAANPCQVDKPFPSEMFEKDLKTMPVLTTWQSSRGAGGIVFHLAERMSKIKLQKVHKFEEAGLEQEDLTAATEDLRQLYDCYRKQSDAM